MVVAHLWIEARRRSSRLTVTPLSDPWGLYTEALCRSVCCYSDVFCHDLGSNGDVARVWIREHAIDPEVLDNRSGEVGRSSECKVSSLGYCLGTMTKSDFQEACAFKLCLPPLFAMWSRRSAPGVLMRLCWCRDQPRRRIWIWHQWDLQRRVPQR